MDQTYRTMEKINAKTQRTQQENHRVAHFFELRINELKKSGHPRTAEIYLSSYRSFARFLTESAATDNSKTQSLSPSDIDFSQIDAHLIKCYEQYLLQQRKLCMNTVSFYLRTLRAVCNAATESGLDGCPRPFRHVYTGIAPTEKRAIPIHAIRQLKTLDFHGKPSYERARDFFLFSFYTRGMPFVDMAYLKKSNLRNNILQYKRKKTGQALSIGWEECMQDILDKHPAPSDSPYLLPIIQEKGNERKQYRNALFLTNFYLKLIGQALNLPFPLTTYCARHSWATAARNQNIPVSIISECLGHDSEKTTRIYLASLDTAIVDEANRKVLELL